MVLCPLLPRISGVFGVKKFFKFLQKEGFRTDLHPSKRLQSSFKGTRRTASASPPHVLHPDFLKISPHTAARQPDNQAVRQPPHPSSHLGKTTRPLPHILTPRLQKLKLPEAANFRSSKFWRQRKSPEANLGASVERLTRLELATSTLARWCSTN